MRWAVVFILVSWLLQSTEAIAECDCDTTLPLFAEDPLVTIDAGLVSYVSPEMVGINESGECTVDNAEPYYEGEADGIFFLGGEEYAEVQVYTADDFSRWWWATMEELNAWALEKCSELRLVS